MAYNNPSPSQSTTLTPAERSAEARRLLALLREVPEEEFTGRLTGRAQEFVSELWMQVELEGELNVTAPQLHYLRDSWQKFA